MTVKKYLQMVYSSKTKKKFPRTLSGTDEYLYFASDRYLNNSVSKTNMVYLPGSGLWIAVVKKGSRTAKRLLKLGVELIPEVYLERTIKIGA